MKKTYLLSIMTVLWAVFAAKAAPEGEPAIVFHSDAYQTVGEANSFSFLIGASEPGSYVIVDGLGERTVEFGDVELVTDEETSESSFSGNWVSYKAPADGLIKIWGDASKIDFILANGAYITKVEMPGCTNIWYLDMEHNALEELDLTPFTQLQAIYLSDNPFTEETPLKIGTPKPYLAILEIDIVDWLDQSFNMSDYPALQAFDGYHNMSLYNVDPSGCPELLVLSLEMAPVSSLDISHNPKLLRLNISETRITDIDLSHNPNLQHFLASHDSGTINTDYYLQNVDLSNNENLTILALSGNRLNSIDLSHNPLLTNISLTNNNLTSLDLSAQSSIYSLNIRYNDMCYATLPWPEFYEYFYRQKPIEVARSLEVGAELDLSSRVLREGTVTTAQVWRQIYSGEDELLDPSLYSYADGKISFNQAIPDSVYVEYINDVFEDYKAQTRPFRVKIASEMGKPSCVATLNTSASALEFFVGIAGATADKPKTFYVDFGDGELKAFTTDSALGYVGAANKASGNATGTVEIYMPEGDVMTDFKISGQQLQNIDLTKATELIRLDISGCGLKDIDLRYNRCLQQLYLPNNQLEELDLTGIYTNYEKNVLHTLDASSNNISSFTVMATYAMKNLNLSTNSLQTINLENYDNLQTLNLSNNRLEDMNLEHLLSATSVNLSNNRLVYVNPCSTYLVQGVNLSGNLLNFTTLPAPSTLGTGYIYAPQAQLSLPPMASTVNLAEFSAVVDGYPTTYAWKKADGTLLEAGKDYKIRGTVTDFLDPTLGDVYCVLSNEAFPDFNGANVMRTSDMEVVESPGYEVASFTTQSFTGTSPEVIVRATEALQLYVDWTGTGSDLEPYTVDNTGPKVFPVSSIVPGAKVTIYADNADDVEKISVFSIYDIKLDKVNLSRLTKAISINLGNTKLTPEQIQMPDAPDMYDMNLRGNSFESFPYADKYPSLAMLNLSNNNISEFDSSDLQSIGSLFLSNNKLTSISFNNPRLWNLYVDGNELEDINLENLPLLEQLFLQNNKLSHIDVSPVKSSLRVLDITSNYFTFATLPLQSECPNLAVYSYNGQADIDAVCIDGAVDLSDQAVIDGEGTIFTWYVGKPEYDSDQEAYVGDMLEEDVDYVIDDGVTHFLTVPSGKVCCMMMNGAFPSLVLFTKLIDVAASGVESIISESDEPVKVYSLQGMMLRNAPATVALDNLAPGIYIVNGKKVMVK